jgi:hypothetical protein
MGDCAAVFGHAGRGDYGPAPVMADGLLAEYAAVPVLTIVADNTFTTMRQRGFLTAHKQKVDPRQPVTPSGALSGNVYV